MIFIQMDEDLGGVKRAIHQFAGYVYEWALNESSPLHPRFGGFSIREIHHNKLTRFFLMGWKGMKKWWKTKVMENELGSGTPPPKSHSKNQQGWFFPLSTGIHKYYPHHGGFQHSWPYHSYNFFLEATGGDTYPILRNCLMAFSIGTVRIRDGWGIRGLSTCHWAFQGLGQWMQDIFWTCWTC